MVRHERQHIVFHVILYFHHNTVVSVSCGLKTLDAAMELLLDGTLRQPDGETRRATSL